MDFRDLKQWTLGDLIDGLESVLREDEPEKGVVFDFAALAPTTIHSWRGDYFHIAFDFSEEHEFPGMNIKELINYLNGMIGKTLEGWKGGDYEVTRNKLLYVAKPDWSGDTAIIGLADDGYKATILTAYVGDGKIITRPS